MRRLLTSLFLFLAPPAASESDFDYFVMALSWSPSWCALEGDARDSDQCDTRHDHGWILHGLWPQFESSYPQYCETAYPNPTRQMTRDMSDIMGTSGLAWHQWNKHGTCTGLSADAYYQISRRAYEAFDRPDVLRRLGRTVDIAPSVIEDAFLQANPGLERDQITITCRQGHIQEARLCLTKNLELRRCGSDVINDCTARTARFPPVR